MRLKLLCIRGTSDSTVRRFVELTYLCPPHSELLDTVAALWEFKSASKSGELQRINGN